MSGTIILESLRVEPAQSIGLVETRYFTFASFPDELILDSGEKLGSITLAYETYGNPNDQRTNAILVHHALSGDAHAAGFHIGDEKPGWWDEMIGPGKAFDTDKYFVICSNVLGGCKGSTGPSSINPATNMPFGLDFPTITIKDMVRAISELKNSCVLWAARWGECRRCSGRRRILIEYAL